MLGLGCAFEQQLKHNGSNVVVDFWSQNAGHLIHARLVAHCGICRKVLYQHAINKIFHTILRNLHPYKQIEDSTFVNLRNSMKWICLYHWYRKKEMKHISHKFCTRCKTVSWSTLLLQFMEGNSVFPLQCTLSTKLDLVQLNFFCTVYKICPGHIFAICIFCTILSKWSTLVLHCMQEKVSILLRSLLGCRARSRFTSLILNLF